MNKKIIGIFVCILFFGSGIVNGFTIQFEEINKTGRSITLYVGGGGPDNYTKIQDAIDNTSNGDKVFVYNGIYDESVVIDKSINLIGEDKKSTVIDDNGGWATISLSTDNIKLDSFSIQNGDIGILVPWSSNYNKITNCTIYNNGDGIYIEGYYHTITKCNFYNNGIGINSLFLIGSSISDCNFNNSGVGMYFHSWIDTVINNCSIINTFGWGGLSIQLSINVTVSNCYIHNNSEFGIMIKSYDHSPMHTIKDCTISNNEVGILTYQALCPQNSTFYHNNFINNTQNAYDVNNNSWFDNTSQEGNYWDDYTGTDSNRDGIGDTPYPIPGGDNKDLYPLMNPWGENPPIANFTYSMEHGGVIFNASSSYDRDGNIASYDWDFDDGNFQSGLIVNHCYSESGMYNVTLTVTDNDGYKGNITKCIYSDANLPPETPIINGPISGRVGVTYSYLFLSSDSEDGDLFYQILWGDGTSEEWIGPYPSDELITVNHSWSKSGTYSIIARTKDVYDFESEWSNPYSVTMPRDKTKFFSLFLYLIEHFTLLERFLSIWL